jgi:transcriptional regulator with XRE-family HTH domain
MDSNKSLGQKIAYYRKRAGLSQLQLELEIAAGQGSISRIENGQVNPTKETLVNIIKVLNLNAFESADIFNIDTNSFPKIVRASRNLNSSLNLDDILQTAVDDTVYELNLVGAILVLVEGDKLYAKTFTRKWYTQLLMQVLNVPFSDLNTELTKNSKNLFVKTILENKSYYSTKLSDFSVDVIPNSVADLAQKVTTHACAISFPIVYSDKVIGSITFSKIL